MLNRRYNEKIDKSHPGIAKIKEEIDKQFSTDRVNPLTEKEMLELIKKYVL